LALDHEMREQEAHEKKKNKNDAAQAKKAKG
jgi:hypothetical protein